MISQHAEQTLVFSVSGFLSLFLKRIAQFQNKENTNTFQKGYRTKPKDTWTKT